MSFEKRKQKQFKNRLKIYLKNAYHLLLSGLRAVFLSIAKFRVFEIKTDHFARNALMKFPIESVKYLRLRLDVRNRVPYTRHYN